MIHDLLTSFTSFVKFNFKSLEIFNLIWTSYTSIYNIFYCNHSKSFKYNLFDVKCISKDYKRLYKNKHKHITNYLIYKKLTVFELW